MSAICMIAVGYNRPMALKRLLDSLLAADYDGDEVDLLISLDKGQRQEECAALAEQIVWPHGQKRVRAFAERQGLRRHILQCGDMTAEYDAVVVLEDDLTVAQNVYRYVRQTVAFYDNDPRVAGISLYKHTFNVDAGAFFEPAFNGYDAFLMQYAQSWGECWTRRMWSAFKEWYAAHEDLFESGGALRDRLPRNVLQWSRQSWLKYYIAYVIEQGLFYVYPHASLTTNHAEAGEHNAFPNGDFQVCLAQGTFDYRLPTVDDAVKYDAFFERIGLAVPGYEDKRTALDLYGRKQVFDGADVLVSSVKRPYAVLARWALKYRPQEENCLRREPGVGLFVYDLHRPAAPPKDHAVRIRTRYDVRAVGYRRLLSAGWHKACDSLKNKTRRLFQKR